MNPVPPCSLKAPKLTGVDSFEKLREEGFVIFSLAPVYIYAQVAESLPESFAAATGEDMKNRKGEILSTQIEFEHEVLKRCPGWSNMLEVMDANSYMWFKRWMSSLNFVNRDKKKFYVPKMFTAPILDPIQVDLGKVKPTPDHVDVFGLSGLSGVLKPLLSGIDKKDAPLCIDFKFDPPEQDVVAIGKAVLETGGI
jgi:hypothetical protein